MLTMIDKDASTACQPKEEHHATASKLCRMSANVWELMIDLVEQNGRGNAAISCGAASREAK